MKTRGVAIYGHPRGLLDRLEGAFIGQGMEFVRYAIDAFGWKRRMLASREIARAFPEDILIFLDAWDTHMMGTKEELDALNLHEGITFAAQKFCYPIKSREPEYDALQAGQDVGPWRFINSNPMSGLGRNIADAIDWGWERWPIKWNSNITYDRLDDIDERFLTDLYLSEGRERFNIKLDHQCRLNQTYLASLPGELWLDITTKRITNKVHNTTPVFVHFNGKTLPPEGLL